MKGQVAWFIVGWLIGAFTGFLLLKILAAFGLRLLGI